MIDSSRSLVCTLGFLLLCASGCGFDAGTPADSGSTADTGAADTGTADTGTADTGTADTGTPADSGTTPDSGADGGTDAATPADAPTCTITAPLQGTEIPFDSDVTFVASASDPQDGTLTGASVVWTTDRGSAPLGSGQSLSVRLPASGSHVITCTATDASGNVGTDSITVVSVSPRAEIWHPSDGETRAAANPIPFTGRGFDLEDGNLPPSALVWSSSLDGTLNTSGGTSENFSTTLSAGTNVVTLTVTDSNGNMASTSITLTITP